MYRQLLLFGSTLEKIRKRNEYERLVRKTWISSWLNHISLDMARIWKIQNHNE